MVRATFRLMEHLLVHLGVAMRAGEGFEAFLLYLAGSDDAIADGGTGFARLHLGQMGKRHRLYLAMDVDTVE